MTYTGHMLLDLMKRADHVEVRRAGTDGINFKIGPTSFHIGQEVLDSLKNFAPEERLTVLEFITNEIYEMGTDPEATIQKFLKDGHSSK